MNILFNDELMARTIELCKDNLSFHIGECESEEHHSENLAEIELLYRLGEQELAEGYKNDYSERLSELYVTDDYYGSEYIEMLVKELEDMWQSLVGENTIAEVPLTDFEVDFLQKLRDAEANIPSSYEMEIQHCFDIEDGEDGWYVYKYSATNGEAVPDENYPDPIITDKDAELLAIDVEKCLDKYGCLYVGR
ncbi:MAG: hypothetical protein IKS98_08090 [Lachnospiraceae bacterium]|nr:hypothetical protein [Lachnospiraceae bacterium]